MTLWVTAKLCLIGGSQQTMMLSGLVRLGASLTALTSAGMLRNTRGFTATYNNSRMGDLKSAGRRLPTSWLVWPFPRNVLHFEGPCLRGPAQCRNEPLFGLLLTVGVITWPFLGRRQTRHFGPS